MFAFLVAVLLALSVTIYTALKVLFFYLAIAHLSTRGSQLFCQ